MSLSFVGLLPLNWARRNFYRPITEYNKVSGTENEVESLDTRESRRGPVNGDLEAALRTFQDKAFETARTDTNYSISSSVWEVALDDESQPWSREVSSAGKEETPVKQ